MHPTRSAVIGQRRRVNTYRSHSDSYSFFNLLTSDALLDKVEALLPEHRERLYPPTETLSMFLAQAMSADRSCQNIVNQAAIQRLVSGFSGISTRTGGYCRARQRLPLEMISKLAHHLGGLIDQLTPDQWRWQGRRVRLVDGTTATMPDTLDNQNTFPQQRGQKAGLGFPICRIVGITCLSSGALLNAAIGRFNGKGGDEQTLLRSIQDTFQTGDVVLGDAFFATYFFIANMQRQGVDIVLEQNGPRRRSVDFRKGQRLGQRDHLIIIEKPKIKPGWMSEAQYASEPESITVRECKTGGKILVTTIICPKAASKSELKALYKTRWHVELDIRHIKDTLGMNTLSCKRADMALKEIWIYFLAYNLIRLMIAQSALLADILPRQISFKHSLQVWIICLPKLSAFDDHQLHQLFALIAQQRVGNRPGRIEPRAVKRRPKPFPLLMKPRVNARTEVVNNGHPKKLK
jgi:hypothetical protein